MAILAMQVADFSSIANALFSGSAGTKENSSPSAGNKNFTYTDHMSRERLMCEHFFLSPP